MRAQASVNIMDLGINLLPSFGNISCWIDIPKFGQGSTICLKPNKHMSELLRYYLGKDTNIWNTRDGDFAATAPESFI